jgi:two-component system sensor histidine kinase BarA
MRLPVLGELNLATKLLGLFGLAVTAVAMQALIDAGQLETARVLHDAWVMLPRTEEAPRPATIGDASVQSLDIATLRVRSREDWRLAEILRTADDPRKNAEGEAATEVFLDDWRDWAKRYTYARIRRDETGRPTGVVVLERTSDQAASEAAINSLFLLSAGVLVLAVAMTTFWLITARLILRPVKSLRLWAESVGDGNTDERVELKTGDEFQQLAETFNETLDQLEERERTLQSINIAMDVRLNELAEVNEALDKAARLKSEFLAGVSHELRTPLNSIIGFAELLLDIARQEEKRPETAPDGSVGASPGGAQSIAKRKRYLENIVEGSRGLLELIEGLLEMARIEAGKTEVNRELLNPVDACRGMLGLAEPLANRNGVTLELDARPEVPLIETDPRKFQQIVFNLVTNAIKFTGPEGSDGKAGRVLVRVERVPGESGTPSVRVCVIDNGPGIAPEDQQAIFERFSQLEGGHERRHGGVGLGLAICRDLSNLLQADLQLVSEPGQGAMFSVIFPLRLDMSLIEEARLEARFRGVLNRQSI